MLRERRLFEADIRAPTHLTKSLHHQQRFCRRLNLRGLRRNLPARRLKRLQPVPNLIDPDHGFDQTVNLCTGWKLARNRGKRFSTWHSERGVGNICNAPLRPGDGGEPFRDAFETRVLPELKKFQPDIVFISAGFDAHRADPLASLNLVEADFAWATQQLAEVAHKQCGGRLVSMLEGGYDLTALARSVSVHVKALMDAGS